MRYALNAAMFFDRFTDLYPDNPYYDDKSLSECITGVMIESATVRKLPFSLGLGSKNYGLIYFWDNFQSDTYLLIRKIIQRWPYSTAERNSDILLLAAFDDYDVVCVEPVSSITAIFIAQKLYHLDGLIADKVRRAKERGETALWELFPQYEEF